ncbi:MAG: DNA polymerase III subunit beta [Myxococcota bacterium]
MELTISKKDLLRSLARTHGVADRKSSMPILSNVLIRASSDRRVRFAATDLYLGVVATAECEVKKEGSLAVSARTLFDIAKNLPDSSVRFSVDEGQSLEIRCGRVRYRVPAMPGDDFPPLPNPGEASFSSLDANLLGELITLTQYSMSSDDTRPHLAGALFEGEGALVRMVTTDGHRLSKAERSLSEEGSSLGFSMLVPHKGIGELRRVIEDARSEHGKKAGVTTIEVATDGGSAFFRRHNVLLSIKLASDQFPPYSKVIPQQQVRQVGIPRSSFVEALKRISLVANEKSGGIRLRIEDGKLHITSENPEVGEGAEELDVDYAGESLEIGFNARYLMDVIGALAEEEVLLELSGELDPGVVRPVQSEGDFVGVIMPMRI